MFLIGLALICIGGYISLNTLWNGMEKSIIADVGLRVVSTGYGIAVASGWQRCSASKPSLSKIPYFGPVQAIGVMIGEALIAIGFLLLIPFHPVRK